MNQIKSIGSFLLSLVFPKTCISCGREGAHLCEDCLSLLSIHQWVFPVPPDSHLSELFFPVSYQEPLVRILVHKLKYRPFLKDLSLQCAYLMGAHLALARPKQDFSGFVVVPVPLHKRRLRWRRYNQAQAIAMCLGGMLSAPLACDVLFRTKHTSPQASLKREERVHGMRGAFEVRGAKTVCGKSILLVDDVYTTGATMEECARVLKKAGAAKVFGAVVARG